MVIGFSEEEWVELQMEGEVYLVGDKEELDKVWGTYAGKFAGAEKYKDSKDDVILKFIPRWWRYTEFRPKPARVISSEGN